MATHGRKNIDEILIQALACGAQVEQAAAKAGVSARTAYRRLKDPAFRQRILDLKTETMERAGSMLTAATLQSVKTLLSMQEASVPFGVRLGASRAILDFAFRFREFTEFQDRLAAVEQQLAINHSPPIGDGSA
jgi:hypothetical protein